MSPDWLVDFADLLGSVSIRAAALAAGVGAALAICRVPPGAVRHAAWAAAAASMLMMPALLSVSPSIEVPLPFAIQPAEPREDAIVEPADSPDSVDAVAPIGAQTATASIAVATVPGASATSRGQSTAPGSARFPWLLAGVAAYAAGVLFFLTRLAIGWMLAHRLVASSRPWGGRSIDDGGVVVCESPRVATPLTVGLVNPCIILPATWRSWSGEQLRAVLAHERAHAKRRDPVITFVAFVNRAVFWFHPLAWWLVRAVVVHAEDACDSAAITTMATPGRYAEVLAAMADTVRRHGGRVAWQGVGVDGAGFIGHRIDRILRGDLRRGVSRARRVAVTASCAIAVAIAASCRPSPPPPAPLQPDSQVTERRARYAASDLEFKAILAMTTPQVADLEAALQKNPEDADTRKTLLTFYRSAGHKTVGWNETVTARRRHILWLIEHRPADRWLLQAGGINPSYDPTGYAQAKALWNAATSANDVSSASLGNAASFFREYDWPLAEQYLLRARAIDPGGPQPRIDGIIYSPPWSAGLGSLYVRAIVSVSRAERTSAGSTSDVTDAGPAFAAKARRILDDTTDATMLISAGAQLTQSVVRRDPPAAVDLGFDPQALGSVYLERAIALDPERAPTARSQLIWLASIQRQRQLRDILKDVPKEKQPAVVLALPDAERIVILPGLAESTYSQAGFQQDAKRDAAAADAARALARAYAGDLLKLADSRSNDPNRGTALFSAHAILGLLALHDNDMKAALTHMAAAGNAPPSEELRYGNGNTFVGQRLATGMLKRGERESVARFLDRCAALSEVKGTREQRSTAAAAIRAGRMPEFYQYQTMPF